MRDIWFTSDHHFGHYNIIKHCDRPFTGVHEMNMIMQDLWNDRVKDDDVVYYLGDFAMKPYLVDIGVPQLKGHKTLVVGNHDKCFKFKVEHVERYKKAGFEIITDQINLYVPDKFKAILSHFPYRDTPHTKYTSRRPVRKQGKNPEDFLLCGHVHEKWQAHDGMINVGVDVWDFAPVHIDEIEQLARKEGYIT